MEVAQILNLKHRRQTCLANQLFLSKLEGSELCCILMLNRDCCEALNDSWQAVSLVSCGLIEEHSKLVAYNAVDKVNIPYQSEYLYGYPGLRHNILCGFYRVADAFVVASFFSHPFRAP